MIITLISKNIDLVNIESLKKWIEYMPECFTSNLKDKIYNDRLIEDRFILHNINNLYKLIEEITGNKPDAENRDVYFIQFTLEQYDRYKKFKSNIPNFDIEKYAKLKLTQEEQSLCHNFVDRCTLENSSEIVEEINGISNFYIKSYARYLLINMLESNYKFSINSIREQISKSSKEVQKRLRVIKSNKAEALENAQYKIYH